MRRPNLVAQGLLVTHGLLAALLAIPLVAAGCASGGTTPQVRRTAADLTNPRLSPAWSQWLVGGIGWLARGDEITAYLALADDAAAAEFVEGFWQRRDPDPSRPGNPVRELFDERARDADKRFSEAGYLGRRTDRGTLLILHGEPKSIEFELNPRANQPPLEVWTYERPSQVGLDGRPPLEVYRFIKTGDITTLFTRPVVDPRQRNADPRESGP